MKFSLLMDILNKADMVTDVVVKEDCEVEDLNLMDRNCQHLYARTVYFIRAEDIGPATKLPTCLIYQGEVPEFREKSLQNCAKIRDGLSLAEVFRYVKLQLCETPELQAQYGDIVTKLISGVDLRTIFTDAATYTGNLFVAIDISGKIIEHSEPFYVDVPVWMNSIYQGYCDETLMDYINLQRRQLNVPKNSHVVELYCQKMDKYIMVEPLWHNNASLGYVFALNSRPAFDSYTRKMLPLFAHRVKEGILRLKDMDRINDYRSIMRTNILLDAVAGATPAETNLRAKISGLKFQKYMRAMVIRTPYSKDTDYYTYILMPELTKILVDQPCFPWHSSLVCLVSTQSNGELPEDKWAQLQEMAEKQNLLVGVSNVFSGISEFGEHFNQANKVLEFSTRTDSVGHFFFYLDYVLYIILDQVKEEQFLDHCYHPALKQLADYDRKKGGELFETLRVYAETGFNKAQAAQMLFIHRNTINYRIQQIEQLCSIDLSGEKNAKLLFNLQLSFKIFLYRKNRMITHD